MKPSSLSLLKFLRTRDSPLLRIRTMTITSNPPQVRDDLLCSDQQQQQSDLQIEKPPEAAPASLGAPGRVLSIDTRVEQAWAHWKKLGRPKYIVAPMVDNSELPFRLLCQKYGAQAAYTPMLHSRIFTETDNRNKEFTTCEEDRPLFVQFCANDPDTLLEAAKKVAPYCDYVDINLGCPQRIARRGNYGAFLMDNLPLVKSLVEKLAQNLTVPVSCKIRIFPNLQDTLNYAKMLEDAGCSLLAVHGRTRDEKDGKKFRADWGAIKEVRNALRIPVLANGNVRCIEDVEDCIKETGVEGVLSAETLLENPAVFAGFRTAEWAKDNEGEGYVDGGLDQGDLVVEYLKLCEKHPVPWRKPPPPRVCGVPHGPPITSPRIKLSDGRYLAYRESGVDRANANHKIIVVHGFNNSKDMELPISKDLIEELGIYFLFFDRAGYGESDPHPTRTVKSEAYDIQELADKLNIGPKFYVIGLSVGAYSVYSCLKYIPHRLAGAVLVVPFVSYWWTKVPQDISSKAFKLLPEDVRWTFRVAHYVPWLLYWWLTHQWFSSSSIISGNSALLSDTDLVIIKKMLENPSPHTEKVRQQGDHECLHRDMIAGFATWEFDPTELENPFTEGVGSVHMWQGTEDRVVPREINEYISKKLPWIKYHEVQGYGHLLSEEEQKCEDIIKALLVE